MIDTRMRVTIYSKPRCGACTKMREAFDQWLEETDKTVDVHEFSAIENAELLRNGGHLAAPVYYVEREGEVHSVSGLQPDLLVDTLNGYDSIWG